VNFTLFNRHLLITKGSEMPKYTQARKTWRYSTDEPSVLRNFTNGIRT
jgi:hypothetical protein